MLSIGKKTQKTINKTLTKSGGAASFFYKKYCKVERSGV
jgi:hypothetical protein